MSDNHLPVERRDLSLTFDPHSTAPLIRRGIARLNRLPTSTTASSGKIRLEVIWSLQPYTRGVDQGAMMCYQAGNSFAGVDAVTGIQRWRFDWDWDGENELDMWSWLVVDGLAFLRGSHRDLVVLDALSGRLRWQRRTKHRVYLAVEDGVAYIASRDGSCLAVDAGSGSERWRLDIRPSAQLTAVSACARIVCLSMDSGEVVGIDAATGATRWKSSAAPVYVTIQGQFGLVYLEHADRLVALDALTGLERWRFAPGGRVETRIPRRDRTIHVVNHLGSVMGSDRHSVLNALDAVTGEQVWRYETNRTICSVRVVDDVLYMTDGDYYLHSLDTCTGDESWCSDVGGDNDGPLVVNDTVFYAAGTYGLLALDARTGEERWGFSPDSGLDCWQIAVANGLLYAGTGATLFVLHALTGEELWQMEFDGLVITHVEIIDDAIWVHGDDFLHVLRLIPD